MWRAIKMKEARTGPQPYTEDKDIHSYNFVVPPQFHDLHFRFLKVRKGGKEAVEPGWQKTKNYSWHDPETRYWVNNGGNYGLTCPSGFCVFIDADTKEIQETLETKLPLTFRYSTGKEDHFQYVFFVEDEAVGCIPLLDGAYIKGRGGYVIGPGSVHPNGIVYGSREIRDVPVATVTKKALLDALTPFLLKKPQSRPPISPIYARASPITEEQIQKVATGLLPAWIKADHVRHNLTLAIVGTCERAQWTENDVQTLVDLLIEKSGRGQEHAIQIKYAYGRKTRKFGIPSLKRMLEDLI